MPSSRHRWPHLSAAKLLEQESAEWPRADELVSTKGPPVSVEAVFVHHAALRQRVLLFADADVVIPAPTSVAA